MEFGPDARARTPHQQAYRFAAVAESQHEQSGSTILAVLRVAHHRATAVIDLGFFSWVSEDNPRCLGPIRSTKLANETLHRLISTGIAVMGDQVLPDGLGIAPTGESLLDQLTVRFTGTCR